MKLWPFNRESEFERDQRRRKELRAKKWSEEWDNKHLARWHEAENSIELVELKLALKALSSWFGNEEKIAKRVREHLTKALEHENKIKTLCMIAKKSVFNWTGKNRYYNTIKGGILHNGRIAVPSNEEGKPIIEPMKVEKRFSVDIQKDIITINLFIEELEGLKRLKGSGLKDEWRSKAKSVMALREEFWAIKDRLRYEIEILTQAIVVDKRCAAAGEPWDPVKKITWEIELATATLSDFDTKRRIAMREGRYTDAIELQNLIDEYKAEIEKLKEELRDSRT